MPAAPFLHFTLPDPGRSFRHARLYQELQRPYDGPAMAYDDRRREWRVELSSRGATRVEYLFTIQDANGDWSTGPDPGNGLRAPGPFGDKSVVELAGYRPPAWLGEHVDEGAIEPVMVPSRRLGRDVPVLLWTPAGYSPADRLPLLVALDGPELVAYSSLLALLGQAVPVHLALLGPVERNDEYSASAAFARALATEVVPTIAAVRNVPDEPEGRAGMGVSLGGLAMLHAHRMYPELFGALFLQSGSFFQPRTDRQESTFVRFARVRRFVRDVVGARSGPSTPATTVLTCGTVEENLANNRRVRDALAQQGYDVRLVEHPDGHNWVSWRDVLDPHLPDLLTGLKT